jgi:hypothetical protein
MEDSELRYGNPVTPAVRRGDLLDSHDFRFRLHRLRALEAVSVEYARLLARTELVGTASDLAGEREISGDERTSRRERRRGGLLA